MEDADLPVGALVLPLECEVDVQRLLRFQVRIADPVPAEMISTRAAVHLPVVEELAESRLAVARADVRLETAVFRKHVCHAEVQGRVRTEAVAVVDAQDGREDGLRRHLPAVLHIGVGLCEIRLAEEQLVLPRGKALPVVRSVECDVLVLLICRPELRQCAVVAEDGRMFIHHRCIVKFGIAEIILCLEKRLKCIVFRLHGRVNNAAAENLRKNALHFLVCHRWRFRPVVFTVSIPDEAVFIADKFIVVDVGAWLVVYARRIVINIERLVIVPRVDLLRIALRRIAQT